MYLSVRLGRDGRDGFREPDAKPGVAIDVHLDRLGIKISRGEVPVLPFSAVRRQLNSRAIRPVEGLVMLSTACT